MKSFNLRKQQGQVFIVMAMSLVMLVGAVGLAVDSGMGYLLKAKLNAAADAAVVAGARAAAQGLNEAEQRAQAVAAAQKFFAANYPDNYLGTKGKLTNVTVDFDDPSCGSITVKVDAQTSAATSFMRVLGFQKLDISAQAQAVRKDLDMSLVVDTSDSMTPVAAKVKEQVAAFLDHFSVTTDRISLIHFAMGAKVDEPIRTGINRGFDRQRMDADIKAFKFEGYTNSAEGFWNGRDQLNRIAAGNRSSMRVIVFFSDGSPNTFASFFKFRNPGLCNRAGALSTTDASSGAPFGLWDFTKTMTPALGGCYQDTAITSNLTAAGLPDWYNAHNINDREFRVVTNGPRVVTNDTSTPEKAYININRASRNLVEAMAARARAEGIYVFTLGLGPQLKMVTGPAGAPGDTGENLLKCMANTPDALPRCQAAGKTQPAGVYCHADTADDLQPCFATLAAEILRITR